MNRILFVNLIRTMAYGDGAMPVRQTAVLDKLAAYRKFQLKNSSC